jgi:hypothetical protein
LQQDHRFSPGAAAKRLPARGGICRRDEGQDRNISRPEGRDRLPEVRHVEAGVFATLCREKGMSYEEIMKFTGNKSIKMLEKYLNVTNAMANTALLKVWGEELLPVGS